MATKKKTKRPKKHPGGRPTKYKPEFAEQCKKLCLLGYTDTQLADFYKVNADTIYEWKKVHPEFSEALKEGKDIADGNVAVKLYERAIGYEHDAVEIKVVADGFGLGSSIQEIPVVKKYPPDTAAAIFWLKNRQPDKWRDKTEVETTPNMPAGSIDFENMPPELLKEIEKYINHKKQEPGQ